MRTSLIIFSGEFFWEADISSDGTEPEMIFTKNETNMKKLFNVDTYAPYFKDAFHEYIIQGLQQFNPFSIKGIWGGPV